MHINPRAVLPVIVALGVSCQASRAPQPTVAVRSDPPTQPAAAASALSPPTVEAAPSAAPQPETSERECGLHHGIAGIRWSRVGDDFEPPDAALAVSLGYRPPEPQLEKLCNLMHKRFEPNVPIDDGAECLMRFGPERQGVWAVIEDRPAPQASVQSWRLVYISPSGRATVSSKTKGRGPSISAITDFDRDNAPEVITREMFSTDSAGGSRNAYTVWTLKRGVISRYGPAKDLQIVWLTDQDRDGVPELVLDPYRISVGSAVGWSEGLSDWTILARADASGRFETTGPVPQSYARQLCPRPPRLDRLFDDEPSCYALDTHCARLWGVGEAEIKTALDKACAGHSDDGSMCDYSMRGWRTIAETALPFVLTSELEP
jgi:hypothetical protein